MIKQDNKITVEDFTRAIHSLLHLSDGWHDGTGEKPNSFLVGKIALYFLNNHFDDTQEYKIPLPHLYPMEYFPGIECEWDCENFDGTIASAFTNEKNKHEGKLFAEMLYTDCTKTVDDLYHVLNVDVLTNDGNVKFINFINSALSGEYHE